MSSKENAAINQLFERLECRYALRVLWALRDGHPQTFRLLQDSVGGITPNTLNTRIKELREAGRQRGLHRHARGRRLAQAPQRRAGFCQPLGRWARQEISAATRAWGPIGLQANSRKRKQLHF